MLSKFSASTLYQVIFLFFWSSWQRFSPDLPQNRVFICSLGNEFLIFSLSREYNSELALLSTIVIMSSDPNCVFKSYRDKVASPLWLWAPYFEIFFEHGQRVVTGTYTVSMKSFFIMISYSVEFYGVIQQRRFACYRRFLFLKIRKTDLNVRSISFSFFCISKSIESMESTCISLSSHWSISTNLSCGFP